MYSPPTKEASKIKFFLNRLIFTRRLQIRERKVNFLNNLCIFFKIYLTHFAHITYSSHLVIVVVAAKFCRIQIT